jgi:hypothetical protein
MPNKEMVMVKGRERRFITCSRTYLEKRQSKHSAHLWPSLDKDMKIRAGSERYM